MKPRVLYQSFTILKYIIIIVMNVKGKQEANKQGGIWKIGSNPFL